MRIFLHASMILIGFLTLSSLSSINAQNLPIILEVEEGVVGSDFTTSVEDVSYVSINTNAAGDNPVNANRVISMEVTFPAAQEYDLYIRFRVGPNAADDDSFFYGNGFGQKSSTDNNDWVRVNNVHSTGYIGADMVVNGEGTAATNVWKWINLSEFLGDETPAIFEVTDGNLTQTIQLGAREDGLDIDKIAFGRADYFFTVSNLDNVEEGADTNTGGPTMTPIADGKQKFLGCVYSQSQQVGFLNYWNQVTPENAGKWGSVEGQMDVMNWTEMDAAYALAKDNGFAFKFHVLVWGNQQPSWIENLSSTEQLVQIEEWFAAVAERYPDIDFIEVVNEPLHDPPSSSGNGGGNYIEALGGSGATGWDWIITAFQMARTHFPNAELMINEYNIINNAGNVNDYLEIIDLLIAEDLLDQIGFQAHAFSTTTTETVMTNNLNTLATRNLPLYVTELDIDGPTDQIQLEEFQRIFPLFWEHPAVKGVTLWGYRVGMWRTDEKAYLIDEDGVTERPALIWLRDYVENTILNTKNPIANSDHISIFPNPVSNRQSIIIKGVERIKFVEIYNMSGQKIWADLPNGNTINLNDTLLNGFYVLKIYTEHFAYTKKVIVE